MSETLCEAPVYVHPSDCLTTHSGRPTYVAYSDPGLGIFPLSRPMVCSYHSQGNNLICEPKVILYYDYFLTLPKEVEGYWCAGSYTWASIVFLANRYVAVLGHLPLFYVILGSPCKASVSLNFLALRCSLIISSVSACEPLNLDAHPSLGSPLILGPQSIA